MTTKSILLSLVLITMVQVVNAQNLAWAKQFKGYSKASGNSIVVDASGNVYTTGFFESTVDFDPGIGVFELSAIGSNDVFVSKLDPSGNFLWAKQFKTESYTSSIAVDASGNVCITGDFSGTVDFDPAAGTSNTFYLIGGGMFVCKLDSSGNFLWAKRIASTYPESIALDGLGNVYTTGYFFGVVDFDPGAGILELSSAGGSSYSDIFISKLDASGNFVWAKQFNGAATQYRRSNSIAVDVVGNVLTTGNFSGSVDFDPSVSTFTLTDGGAFISKLDASGNFVWAKQFAASSGGASGGTITSDASGNVYIAGGFKGTVDFDPSTDIFNLTVSIPDGSDSDAFISKLDASGNFLWAKQLVGESVSATSIAVDASGNVYTTGYVIGTVDFDPGSGTFDITSLGTSRSDMFIFKLNALGDFVWAKQLAGNDSEAGSSIAVDASGNIYTTGYFTGTVDFDPGVGALNLSAFGYYGDVFIHKMSSMTTGVTENSFKNQVTVYPNPTEDIIRISTVDNTLPMTLYDLQGRIMQSCSSTPSFLNIKDLPLGMYFLKIGNSTVKIQKI